MQNNGLLKSAKAKRLYKKYVKDLPIIDFHNHLSPEDLAKDRKYENITQLWIAQDPYKHRLMRICGVEENRITGTASDYEKFSAFASVFPSLAGTPVFDWAKMELSFLFGIKEPLNEKSAERIWKKTKKMLAGDDFSHNNILKRFSIAYQSPVVKLCDDLSYFTSPETAPSLRGDDLLLPNKDLYQALESQTGISVTGEDSYLEAVKKRLDLFSEKGCRFADHALDADFFEEDGEKKEKMLCLLAKEYAARGFTLLLHLDAKRKTSKRLLNLAGPAGGYAAVGGSFPISRVIDLLGKMEAEEALPDTVLFPLNLSDMPSLAVAQGSFSQDLVSSKVQLGPAWWWCDHAFGIRYALDCISSFGVLSRFIGMTTDSRNVLSFVRHDYFRQILTSYIAEKSERENWGLKESELGEILRRICFENAKEKIGF